MISRHKMWAVLWATLWAWGAAQYIGEDGLSNIQQTAVIGGASRDLDQIGPKIYTNRTNTTLNCASGSMLVDVVFNEPFYGIIYPNGSRNSACRVQGHGKTKYHLDLPLKGCGTNRVERRVFVNNIIVRFHPGLELEGDEVKTIICRYPSPEVIPPPAPPVAIIAAPVPTAIPQRVGEIEILLIICAILFLALLLVGMACSYTCLKKRNIKLVRRRPMSLGAPSDITKVSGSLLFDGVKIPRAHATSTSDSDTALVSQPDTMPSDYPSDPPSSGSEVEELDIIERRSSGASSRIQEETIQAFSNQAFVMEEDRLSSVYSDAMLQSDAEMITASQMIRPPMPSFMVRVKRSSTPPKTPPKTPEPDYPVQLAHAQSLTTILERDESFRAESIPGSEHALLVSEAGDLIPPPYIIPPPEYALVHRKTQQHPRPPPPPSEYSSVARSVSEQDLEIDMRQAMRRDIRHIENVENLTTQITDIQETVERNGRRYLVRRPPSEPESEYPSEGVGPTEILEELPIIPRPPAITSHVVDDRHLSTITETHTTEDIERHRRYVKQYHVKPKALPPPKWNVAIRHYPGPKYADEVESSGPEWEGYSEPGSDIFRQHLYQADEDRLSQIEVETLEHPHPTNWNVLLRVLEPPPTEEAVQYVLTREDKEKWRQIICTESTLRTMLTHATVREDYERIRHDQRYEKLFEPRKWDVIIRILSPPGGVHHDRIDSSSEAPSASDTESLHSRDGRRYRKNDSAPGGRRPSLPPLYEYDLQGNPMIMRRPGPPSARSRRSSKSSIHSGIDVRSVTETEVNFARGADTWSEASGPSMVSGARSIADRSQPEMTYTVPVLPDDEYPDTDFDDRMSARTGRSLARSASEFTEDWTRHHEPADRYSHVSASSVDSKRRQLERSTSEYFEEPPHFIDVMTSPDHSPEGSPRAVARFQHHEYRDFHHDYDNQQFGHQYVVDDVVEGGYVLHTEASSNHQQRRIDHRSDRSTHSAQSGREEMYSVAETEVSGWARKH